MVSEVWPFMKYMVLVVQDGMRYLSWSFGVHVPIRQVEESLQNLKRDPRFETFVPDSSAKEIVDELISCFGSDAEPRGMVFVKEVSEAYEIGSKQSGEAILTVK